MKLSQLKTIDINAKQWRDKINGNSYFSSDVTLNYGMKNEKVIKLPFQYGYGNAYVYESLREIQKLFPRSKWYRENISAKYEICLLYTSPSPRDMRRSRMPSSA